MRALKFIIASVLIGWLLLGLGVNVVPPLDAVMVEWREPLAITTFFAGVGVFLLLMVARAK